jgi:hypothetical protein
LKSPSWKHYLPVMQKPTGLVHVIYSDDTEKVLDATNVDWHAGYNSELERIEGEIEARVNAYASVTPKYQEEFSQGQHRAVNTDYRMTSKLLKNSKAKRAFIY